MMSHKDINNNNEIYKKWQYKKAQNNEILSFSLCTLYIYFHEVNYMLKCN